ncbi:hypothetical protein BVG16_00200 [Paenibacillus selenitireducens]|uniref:DUF423 domain-containing protein n=1 Tax=Paenibacillus selenitireducens TaxID=1324314 RepID=A0A1T2XLX8_9BACL|nr:DUF423 domain-containing protein [Paenibacillus selenitireducens]OPA80815.1 hypothetical protein BVG16_00200 [Paenibacillus selenitireducens]
MLRKYVVIGSLNLLVAVALGAFGAHGLKSILTVSQLNTYETGVHYHMIHALGILLIAVLSAHLKPSRQLLWSGRMLFAGIICFSGSLYVLSVTGITWLGIITPIGGVAFIIGWLLLAVAALRNS